MRRLRNECVGVSIRTKDLVRAWGKVEVSMIFRFLVWNHCRINQGKKDVRRAGLRGRKKSLYLNIMNLRILCPLLFQVKLSRKQWEI